MICDHCNINMHDKLSLLLLSCITINLKTAQVLVDSQNRPSAACLSIATTLHVASENLLNHQGNSH